MSSNTVEIVDQSGSDAMARFYHLDGAGEAANNHVSGRPDSLSVRVVQ